MGTVVLCTAAILYDILGCAYRQRTVVMEVAWPITALYLGPLGLWAYNRLAARAATSRQKENGASPKNSLPASAATGGKPGAAARPPSLLVPASNEHGTTVLTRQRVLGSQPGLHSEARGRDPTRRTRAVCVPKTLQPVAERTTAEAQRPCLV